MQQALDGREAEVGNDRAIADHHDVRCLEVVVHDARGVQRCEAAHELRRHALELVDRERARERLCRRASPS